VTDVVLPLARWVIVEASELFDDQG